MQGEKTKFLIILGIILIVIYLALGFFLSKWQKPLPTPTPTSTTTHPPTPLANTQTSTSSELSSEKHLELLQRDFSSTPKLEEKSKEDIKELPASLTPLVDKIKETVNLDEFKKIEYKGGKVGYSASFISQKSLMALSKDFSELIQTQGWSFPKGGRSVKAYFLESENKKSGFILKIDAIVQENSIVNGSITFISMK